MLSGRLAPLHAAPQVKISGGATVVGGANATAVGGSLSASVGALTFGATAGGADPPAQTITITNTGGGSGTWTASAAQPWIRLSPASGSSGGTLAVNVSVGSLTTGSYGDTISVTASGAQGSPLSIAVTFIVNAPPSVPVLSAINLNPTSVQGGSGNTSQGTAVLSSAAPQGGATVTLSSSNTAVATVPANVVIPQGTASAVFVAGTSPVTSQQSVTISGSYGGTQNATLTVLPAPPPSSSASTTVSITDRSGAAQTNRPVSISYGFKQGDIPNCVLATVAGTALTTQTDVKNRWPDGSLKFGVVSFVVPSIPAGGTVTAVLSNQAGCNNTGQLAQSDMLSAPYNFDAQIQMNGAVNQSVSARTMLSAGAWRYWLQGPVVTAVILEDRTTARAYDVDFGDGSKPLHPIFEAWFYPQSNKVQVGYTVENIWVSSSAARDMRDASYSVTLTAGNSSPSIKFSNALFNHIGRSRWHRAFWLGADPPAVHVDYNLAYLVSTSLLPNYDTGIQVTQQLVQNTYSAWAGSPQAIPGNANGVGNYLKSLSQAGGSPWIGLMPSWDVVYLYSMDDGLRQASLGNADQAGRIPWHFREADDQAGTGHWFDKSGTGSVSTFGRVVSVNARQAVSLGQLNYDPANCDGGSFAGDKIVTGAISDDGWGFYDLGRTHMPDVAYLPYLMSGQYYYLEELQLTAAYAIAWSVGCSDSSWQRQGNWGLFNDPETRGDAWAYRTVTYAASLSPDGTPEKAYFDDKLRNNIARDEGRHRLTNTDASRVSIYNWAKNNQFSSWGASPLGIWDVDTDSGDVNSPVRTDGSVKYATSPWMEHFAFAALGVARDVGYPTDNLLTYAAKSMFHPLLDSAAGGPYFLAAYRWPTILSGSNNWIQQWSQFCNYLSCAGAWETGQSIDGYNFIIYGTTGFFYPYTVDGYTGASAWNLVKSQIPEQNRFANEGPKWAILPRNPAPPAPPSPPVISNVASSAPSSGTPLYVQSGGNVINGSHTSIAKAFTGNNTAGNLIVVVLTGFNGTANPALSDTLGNTYQTAVPPTVASDNGRVAVYYAKNIAGGANTVTASYATSQGYTMIYIHEYSGVDTSAPLDQTATGTGTSATPTTSSLTTTAASELLVAGVQSSTQVTAAGSGYTQRQTTGGNMSEDQTVSAVGSYNATFGVTPSGTWVAALATFKASTASASTNRLVTWTTDKSSDSQVDYGLTAGYGSSSTLNSMLVTSHSGTLNELTANTTYHFRVKSRDGSGNLTISGDNTFTTSP